MWRVLSVLMLCAALPAQAQSQAQIQAQDAGPLYDIPDVTRDVPLEGAALESLFQDKLHRGYYDFLAKPDGDYNFTEMMNADGTTLHERDGERAAGRWRIRANVVCFEYDDLGGGCFTLYQRGNCNYAYSIGARDFVAVTVADGKPPSCEPSLA